MRNFCLLTALTLVLFGATSLHAQNVTYVQIGSNQNPALVADAGTSPVDILNIFSDTLTLGGSPTASGGDGNYTYAWSPNYEINDVTAANPKVIPEVDTTYTLILTDGNGCTSTSTVMISTALDITNANQLAIDLNIHPNPSNGMVEFQMDGKPRSEEIEMVITDIVGRELARRTLPRFTGHMEMSLDLSGYSAGTYMLGLISGDQRVFKQLIIQ